VKRTVRKITVVGVTVAALGAGAATAASPAFASVKPVSAKHVAVKPVSAIPVSVKPGSVKPVSVKPGSAKPGSTAIPRCTPTQVSTWIDAESADGAAGSTYYNLNFTNISGTECHLYGYPGVVAIGSNGDKFGDAAVRNNAVAAQYVNLVPGATGHAVLRYVDSIVPAAACKSKYAAFLDVIPPDDTTGRYAFFSLPTCSAKGQDSLQIERVQPGT
jgi:hypothetical protein